MRIALGLLALFGLAVASALFAAGNGATVTLFWPPHRVDVSLNLSLLVLVLGFAVVYLALRALGSVLTLPARAHAWRMAQHERVLHAGLIDAIDHLSAGRYSRARRAAEQVVAREAALLRGGEPLPDGARVRVTALSLAAEAAHALQDPAGRDRYLEQARSITLSGPGASLRDGVLLRALRWALHDADADAAARHAQALPQGVARRTVALRLRLKLARLTGRTDQALETARLLAKHRAFSPLQARSLLRALALEALAAVGSPPALEATWRTLEAAERAMPEVACAAAGRWLRLGGDTAQALHWLTPIWDAWERDPAALDTEQLVVMVRVLENALAAGTGAHEAAWLARIEHAQRRHPAEPVLQYLAGVACLHLQLWGKARALLHQALPRLGRHPSLVTKSWQALADLAEREGNPAEAALAWRKAADCGACRSA